MFMKKIFKYFFAVLCCASAMTAKAANEISIAGVTITDEVAASGIVDTLNKLDGVTATGTITYNSATKTMTFNNASVIASNANRLLAFATWAGEVSIVLEGSNTLKNTNSGYVEGLYSSTYQNHITISGAGNLTISVLNWYPVFLMSGRLIIDNTTVSIICENYHQYGIGYNSGAGGELVCNKANLTATNVSSLSNITLTECYLVQPTGAELVNEDGTWYVDKKESEAPVVISTESKPTQMENIVVETNAVKRIVNGQLVIERDGKTYNAQGAEIQ